jgi:hypothetical protein
VLVDPWLVGDLQFFGQGRLYTGRKRGFGGSSGVDVDVASIAADTDVILITQVCPRAGDGLWCSRGGAALWWPRAARGGGGGGGVGGGF